MSKRCAELLVEDILDSCRSDSMISVVIPLYNMERFIARTLQTVFAQTFQDFEIVIVNDGSTDNSVECVKSIDDPRIRLINQENQGVSVARNTGIREARYDYIALLDADDSWKPDYLESQINLIRAYPDCRVFACAYVLKNHDGEIKNIVLNRIPFQNDTGILDNYFCVASCSHPPLWTSAVVFEKNAFLSTGGFFVGVTAGEDLLVWAKLAVNNKIAYSLEPKAYFVRGKAESYETEPSRTPQIPDIIGTELKKLYRENVSVPGLKKYLAIWHKMRASMFLLFDDKRNTRIESLESLKYNPCNYRVWIYLLLLCCPRSVRYKVFQKFGNS
jgi:glycosyltransferase involved in cell wall biosynthesis